MVMKLHQFVSNQAPPEIHGALAEVGFTAEDIEVPPDEERGGQLVQVLVHAWHWWYQVDRGGAGAVCPV
eukprot:105831-Chlamydomonas_euryale.AAC.1